IVKSDGVQVIDGYTKSDGICNVRRTCFEFMWEIGPSRFLESDFLDHLASTLIWRKFVEPFFFSIKYPDACRPAHLVSRKCIKIAIQCNDVRFDVRSGLSAINQDCRSNGMRLLNDFLNRVDGSQCVGNMIHSNNLRSCRQYVVELIHHKFAIEVHRNDL